MTWQWGAIQGTFLVSDATPPGPSGTDSVVNPTPDAAGLTLNLVLPTTPLPSSVPEIPQWAMLLIGFGGLALAGRRYLRRSPRLSQEDA